MLWAAKKALLAIFAVSALFAIHQPLEAIASEAVTLTDLQGQSEAVAKEQPALIVVEDLLPTFRFSTFKEKSELLAAMRISDLFPIRKDKSVLAVAKEVQITPEPKIAGISLTDPAFTVTPTVEPTTVPMQEIIAEKVEPTQAPEGYALNADVLFNLVNDLRVRSGLAALQKDDRVMQIAQSRAPELFDEIFVTWNMHAGFYARNLPYWATENMIYMRTEQEAFDWWLNSTVHRNSMLGEYAYAGIGCEGKACSMIFTNFSPK